MKGTSRPMSLKLPSALYQALKTRAEAEYRTPHNLAILLLTMALADDMPVGRRKGPRS